VVVRSDAGHHPGRDGPAAFDEEYRIDVILFNAPVTVRNEHARLTPPLGLAYLASALRDAGFSVSGADFNVSGLNLKRVASIVAYDRPSIVGISAMTETYPNALAIARQVKVTSPETVVVLGGAHPTIMPEAALGEAGVDYVIAGAGEQGITALARFVAQGVGTLADIPGLAWREGGAIRVNPRAALSSPDDLPRPARDLFPIEFYRDKWNVLTATGSCPFRCPFCSAASLWHGRRRMRSPESIVAELRDLADGYGVDEVFFTDDLFTMDKRWVRELAEALRGLDRPMEWGCATRVDQVDADLLRVMAEAGCTGVQFGVESGSQQILDSVKGIDKAQVLDAIRSAVAVGIDPVSSFMIPFPEDTEETLAESLAFMREVHEAGSRIFLSYTCPYPGTSFYEHSEELGLRILSDRWDEYDAKHVVMETRHLSASQIESIASGIARELGLQKSVS
jgi:anaerobic magnesium-protoporphyrin IX monomethyl ester cyclase